MYDKETLLAIIDYLRFPSTSKKDDLERRKKLYKLLGLKPAGKKKQFYKYLTGKLGEKIVEVYYYVLAQDYKPKPKPIYCTIDEKKKRIMADGQIGDFLVECKMRQYLSSGTSHEKIHGIAWKYGYTGKMLKLFLLADDEHQYSIDFTKIFRGEKESSIETHQKMVESARWTIDEIILGTEIADVLEKAL